MEPIDTSENAIETTDTSQNDQIAESLRQIDGLNETEWGELDRPERVAAIQEAENAIAEAHGRPPVEIVVDDSAPEGLYGGYNPDTNVISVAGWHIDSDDVREITDTVAHEGRHAYQEYAIQNPGFHPNPDDVEAWRENSDNYLDAASYGQEAYANQPLEADAWQNGSAIANGLFGDNPSGNN